MDECVKLQAQREKSDRVKVSSKTNVASSSPHPRKVKKAAHSNIPKPGESHSKSRLKWEGEF